MSDSNDRISRLKLTAANSSALSPWLKVKQQTKVKIRQQFRGRVNDIEEALVQSKGGKGNLAAMSILSQEFSKVELVNQGSARYSTDRQWLKTDE